MDKASKIFLSIFFALVGMVIVISFVKFFILEDYLVRVQADCDPQTQSCFVTKCDPSTDTTCSKDPAQQTSYYKIIEIKAASLAKGESEITSCADHENCQELFCSDQTKKADDVCSGTN